MSVAARSGAFSGHTYLFINFYLRFMELIEYIEFLFCGDVAQLVSAPDCRSGSCGFEPRRPRHLIWREFD